MRPGVRLQGRGEGAEVLPPACRRRPRLPADPYTRRRAYEESVPRAFPQRSLRLQIGRSRRNILCVLGSHLPVHRTHKRIQSVPAAFLAGKIARSSGPFSRTYQRVTSRVGAGRAKDSNRARLVRSLPGVGRSQRHDVSRPSSCVAKTFPRRATVVAITQLPPANAIVGRLAGVRCRGRDERRVRRRWRRSG
jgi:hypothetical protein